MASILESKSSRSACWMISLVLISAGHFDPAFAQPADSVTITQLRDELAERDAIIVDLLNRVHALEQGRTLGGVGAQTPRDALTEQPAAAGGPAVGSSEAGTEGEIAIDELQAERALERGLVQQGARLLSSGQFEVVPTLSVSRFESDFPSVLTVGGDNLIGETDRTFEVYERNVDLRMGLPFGAQLEVGVPYRTIDQHTQTAGTDGAIQLSSDQSGSGFGDITVGLAKVLVTEQSWRPDLIGRLVWLTGSGDRRDESVVLGAGNSGFSTQLSANWRRDPAVFVITGGYTHYDDEDNLRPGRSLSLSLGMGLALSPETALFFSVDQAATSEFELNGAELTGTDREFSSVGLSASTILGRRLLLRVNTGIGLTKDAPDYRLGVSLSSRVDRR